MASNKKLFLHDSGSCPFELEIFDNKLLIRETYVENNCTVKPEIFKSFQFEKIFYGSNTSDTSNKKTEFGHAVLIKIGPKKYTVLTGYKMYGIDTRDEILEFYSESGGSDIQYPFAIGESYVYILWNRKQIPKKYVKTTTPTAEYLKIRSKAQGWDYIYEQMDKKSKGLLYDTNINLDTNTYDEKYGVLNFTESPGVQKYKKAKFHISDSDVEAFKKYEEMNITVIFKRT